MNIEPVDNRRTVNRSDPTTGQKWNRGEAFAGDEPGERSIVPRDLNGLVWQYRSETLRLHTILDTIADMQIGKANTLIGEIMRKARESLNQLERKAKAKAQRARAALLQEKQRIDCSDCLRREEVDKNLEVWRFARGPAVLVLRVSSITNCKAGWSRIPNAVRMGPQQTSITKRVPKKATPEARLFKL